MADIITVHKWKAPPTRKLTIPTHSDDAIAVWTRALGPTAMLLAYRLAGDIEHADPDPVPYETAELAATMGIAPNKLTLALKRLDRAGITKTDGHLVAIRLTIRCVIEPMPDT